MRASWKNDLSRLAKAARMSLSSPQYFAHAMRLLAGTLTARGRAAFSRSLRGLSLPAAGSIDYPAWLAARVAGRAERYRPVRAPGTFSLLTTVYDTKGRYVLELYESVRRQTVPEFEWVLLDNGSSNRDTLAAIDVVRRDPRVVYERVEDNLGILGGIARCLRRATGRYVVPLDSDDLLTPDALAVLLHWIDRGGEPALLYTDEDKVRDGGAPFEAYHKPDWDPVLFWNSCYIAHLCAIRRETAIELGVYSDDRARGCHDWDTFFRFLRAGHQPVHVPEVVYSWRLHPQSCAGNIFSKTYIGESHAHVLGTNLAARSGPAPMELARSPLFEGTPDFWVRRRREAPAPLDAVFVVRRGGAAPSWLATDPLVGEVVTVDADRLQDLDDQLAAITSHAHGDALVLLVAEGVEPLGDEWPWEAMAIAERFADTAVVGGRLLDVRGNVWSAGEVAGFEGVVGSPDRGRHALDPGYFAWMRKQRSVTAVHAGFCVVRADFLRAFARRRIPASPALLGAWLGAAAAEAGRRVVFTPYLEACVSDDLPPSESAGAAEVRAFLQQHPAFVDGERFYSRSLGLTRAEAFAAVDENARRDGLKALLDRIAAGIPPIAVGGDANRARALASRVS